MEFLIVDDDTTFRERLMKAVNMRGHGAAGAPDVRSALERLRAHSATHAVVDLRMPGDSGLLFIKEARAIVPGLEVVVLTGYGSIPTAVEAIRLGARNYITKPADLEAILRAFSDDTVSPQFDSAGVPSLWQVEWDHLQRVLVECEGNISRAAKRLGMHRRSLQRKLSKLPPR